MPPRASLSAAFPAHASTVPSAEDVAAKAVRPDREGKAPLPIWVPVSARHQLKVLAAELETSMQALVVEGINLIFTKHGKPPIA